MTPDVDRRTAVSSSHLIPWEEAGFEPSVPLCFGAFTRSKTSASGPVGVGGFEKREFAGRGRTSTKYCALRFFFGVTLSRPGAFDRIISAKEPVA